MNSPFAKKHWNHGAINSLQIDREVGEEGLKFVSWSTQHGDLHIAHFIGIHALQILPLLGYAMIKFNWKEQRIVRSVRLASLIYFIIVTLVLVQALMGRPLF